MQMEYKAGSQAPWQGGAWGTGGGWCTGVAGGGQRGENRSAQCKMVPTSQFLIEC